MAKDGKGQKIGRSGRSPSGKAYKTLQKWLINKAKKIEKAKAKAKADAVKAYNVIPGTARRKRRIGLQVVIE